MSKESKGASIGVLVRKPEPQKSSEQSKPAREGTQGTAVTDEPRFIDREAHQRFVDSLFALRRSVDQ